MKRLNSTTIAALKRIDTPNGFIDGNGEIYYYVKDYQGNIRQVTDADGAVLQDNHYYPYGMLMAESSDILAANRSSSLAIASFNPYLYGAKEYLPFKGANILDFNARSYDNSTITFTSPDAKRGDYTHLHSHLYCAGNPIMYVDPSGMTLQLSGTQEDIDKVIEVYESSFGGAMSLSVDEAGYVSIDTDNRENRELNESQKLCCKRMDLIVNDTNNVHLSIVSGSEEVKIGDVNTGAIDIEDMLSIGNEYIVTTESTLWHETNEQYFKFKLDNGKLSTDQINTLAHFRAIGLENCQMGVSFTTDRYFTPPDPAIFQILPIKNTYDSAKGLYYTTNIYFYRNNVTKIEQIASPNMFP